MIQYIVILLDDSSVSFCHYNNEVKEHHPIPIDTLKSAILYAMKENLNIQFVYPAYELPAEYNYIIDEVEHTDIIPAPLCKNADVIVFDDLSQAVDCSISKSATYVLRIDKDSLSQHIPDVSVLLNKIKRLNIVLTDITPFDDETIERYTRVLEQLSKKIESLYVSGNSVQLNILTDRMMLKNMNNCGAGDTSITLAPNGKFYICPAFYFTKERDCIGDLNYSVGDLRGGLDIKNSQLYKLNHAPLCRQCDSYQCKRCIWLNRKMTYEVNTPSHEQCVMAHLERNASRELLKAIRRHGTFLPDYDDIPQKSYIDPLDIIKEFN